MFLSQRAMAGRTVSIPSFLEIYADKDIRYHDNCLGIFDRTCVKTPFTVN